MDTEKLCEVGFGKMVRDTGTRRMVGAPLVSDTRHSSLLPPSRHPPSLCRGTWPNWFEWFHTKWSLQRLPRPRWGWSRGFLASPCWKLLEWYRTKRPLLTGSLLWKQLAEMRLWNWKRKGWRTWDFHANAEPVTWRLQSQEMGLVLSVTFTLHISILQKLILPNIERIIFFLGKCPVCTDYWYKTLWHTSTSFANATQRCTAVKESR